MNTPVGVLEDDLFDSSLRLYVRLQKCWSLSGLCGLDLPLLDQITTIIPARLDLKSDSQILHPECYKTVVK